MADHDGTTLHSSTASVITAAKTLSSSAKITIVITGHNTEAVANRRSYPVSAVIRVDDLHMNIN